MDNLYLKHSLEGIVCLKLNTLTSIKTMSGYVQRLGVSLVLRTIAFSVFSYPGIK